jgi:hypothetical protein
MSLLLYIIAVTAKPPGAAAPRRASRSAYVAPMPDEAPVIRAVPNELDIISSVFT